MVKLRHGNCQRHGSTRDTFRKQKRQRGRRRSAGRSVNEEERTGGAQSQRAEVEEGVLELQEEEDNWW